MDKIGKYITISYFIQVRYGQNGRNKEEIEDRRISIKIFSLFDIEDMEDMEDMDKIGKYITISHFVDSILSISSLTMEKYDNIGRDL